MAERTAEIRRTTKETDISLELNIDGTGISDIDTGVGFFDHMLTLFSRHGFLDLKLKATGDIEVDYHHTVEDVGICLGQAVAKACGDKAGIRRFGDAVIPMGESLATAVIDLCDRPFLVFNAPLDKPWYSRNDSQVWTNVQFDLHDYAGDTILLQWGTYNDGGGGITAMYVDDVTLQACH